jgi:anti-sigma B factor antagonist
MVRGEIDMDAEYKIEIKDNIVVVRIKGDFTEFLVEKLRNEMENFIKQDTKNYILDFSEVSYINSSGLGFLAGYLKKVRKIKGDIKLIKVHNFIKNVLEISKLSHVFDIFDSEEEAVNSFKFGSDVY